MSASLGRAFTRRNKRVEVSSPMPYREGQVKYSSGTIRRNQISGPVELVSSTNMFAYTSPDIRSASSSSVGSGDESELVPTLVGSPLTSPSPSSTEVSPIGPEPNHLSSYFPKRSATISSTARSSTSSSSTDAPSVPKRALSHTKKSHQEAARQRSFSRMSPPPLSMTSAKVLHHDVHQTRSDHPFGRELDKVNEVAEDFSVMRVLEEEEQILLSKGLKKVSVEEYISEIEELYGGIFEDQLGSARGGAWL